MNITTIQTNIFWKDCKKNLTNYQSKIDNIESTDIIILPEMFTTGFTMNPFSVAEKMDGQTISWMKNNALLKNSAICGSIIIEENDRYFNRFVWVNPDGSVQYYDKRHLFSYAGENKNFTAGNSKIIIDYRGWKICPMICYDLRFPVWSRNIEEYDLLIYVANWPNKRKLAWRTLLVARAIENQCYVVGVNRVGSDNNNHDYSGDTSIITALGEKIYTTSEVEDVCTTFLSKDELSKIRKEIPFLKDKDSFTLS